MLDRSSQLTLEYPEQNFHRPPSVHSVHTPLRDTHCIFGIRVSPLDVVITSRGFLETMRDLDSDCQHHSPGQKDLTNYPSWGRKP